MKKLLSVISLLLVTLTGLMSQEFLLHEETFTWTEDADECGGFHYWKDYGEAESMNWKSPNDYQYGQYYFRFEILDQPSNAPVKFNFCIWSEFNSSTVTWKEECTGFSPELNGPGSTVTFNSAMNFKLNGGIDWTDLTKLWRFGNPMWVNGHNIGPNHWCTDYPEEWNNRALYFPMKLRITIVAVASGSTFSGWDNYVDPVVQQPKPTYGIDYSAEKTNKAVPSTDEYSIHADMSGAVSGSGQKLNLTPGTDLYFRTKAQNGMPASDIQHLIVPVRPDPPSVSIDYYNEKTFENIGSEIEYSTSSSYTNAISGNGTKVTLTPGQDLYFQVKATSHSFFSFDTHLIVPQRPAAPVVSIDFPNERTQENIGSEIEYSTSSSYTNVISGNGTKVALTPGQDLYFQVKATSHSFFSFDTHLIVPQRPAAPSVSIDFPNERTLENIGSEIEYSTSSSYSNAISGTGTKVSLTPGQDLYFQVKATGHSFYSMDTHLIVPVRPASPSVSIDYSNEETDIIPASIEYSTNESMSGPANGTGQVIPVTPGTDLFFRVKATSTNFTSAVQHLAVPVRPAAPVYSIDFINESTTENVPSHHEYDVSPEFGEAQPGDGGALVLAPNADYYFRIKYTASAFSSEAAHLYVPMRPVINSDAGDTIQDDFFTAAVDFHTEAEGFDVTDLELTNASAILTDPLTIKVSPMSAGEITVKVKADAITSGNFASDILKTYYKEMATSIPGATDLKASISVYPVPARDILIVETFRSSILPAEIILSDIHGSEILRVKMVSSRISIDVNSIPEGMLHY